MDPDAFHPGRRQWLALAAAAAFCPRPACARVPALLLAEEADADIDPVGWLVSEKLDGVRAAWDGTQLRFRSGRPVAAPASFLARLPRVPLDGELWLGRGCFDEVSGLVRRAMPDDAAWRSLRYMVFERPGGSGPFIDRARELQRLARQVRWPQLQAVPQQEIAGREALKSLLAEVVREGGEGLMLHRADAAYVTGRSRTLLKLKPVQDAEAVVIGHLPGRGRHAGRLGALRVRGEDGTVFDLGTGFSDGERVSPPPLGHTVTYTYRGRTPQGVPRFASFLRSRDAH